MKILRLLIVAIIAICAVDCSNKENENMNINGKSNEVILMTLDPGHFHAALVQKKQYPQVSHNVHIYAPDGDDVKDHLRRIDGYNSRSANPTKWESKIYTGADYLEKMLSEKPGNVMITSGNNELKTEYIKAGVEVGINVLADKPMCIDKDDFRLLLKAFKIAEKNNVLLYDIMTERSEITTILQKELIAFPSLFGTLTEGSPEDPAVIKSSTHHYYKYVSGNPLKRPPWFFDASQQGDGLVDVTTHLVDLVQWELFPEQILDYKTDLKITSSRRWPTKLSLKQFSNITQLEKFPKFLAPKIEDDILSVYSNGEINYELKKVNVKVVVEWKYQAPEGAGDTHYSIIRGTKSNIIIKQGKEENYKPELYVEAVNKEENEEIGNILNETVIELAEKYPGVELERDGEYWHIIIPDDYRIGHEAHFGQVMERYLIYLKEGKLPFWEVPYMITKYYTTTQALELADKITTN